MNYQFSSSERLYEVSRINNSPIDSNCFIIKALTSNAALVIDPAFGKDEFSDLLHLRLDYIILTHEHFDHISSVEELRNAYSTPVVCSQICSERIVDAKKNLSMFYDQIGFTCKPGDILIDHEQAINWEGLEVKFYHTPGHSEAGICIAVGECLFTGDTLMSGFEPVVKLPGGNKSKLAESLKLIASSFDPGTMIFPGHGLPFRL